MSKKELVPGDSQRIIKKNVSAIHISAELSLIQRKLVNALLYNAYENLLTGSGHEINVTLLSEMIGFNTSKNISHLKESLKGLAETSVEFDVLDENGDEVWEVTTLLSFARISKGTCVYRYDKSIAEKLYHPEIYSKINLSVVRDIKSVNALILYENCYRFVNIGETAWWDLETFRKLMSIEGKIAYKQFKILNRDVIKPAVKEINKISNIYIEMETRRKGRSVVAIKFIIRTNPQLSLLDIEEDDEITGLRAYKRLLEKGIGKIGARNWIIEYGEAYVTEKLDHTDKIEGAGKIKSTASGFLAKAIEGDYKTEEAVKKKRVAEADQKRDEKASRERERNALSDQIMKAEKAYRGKCINLIESRFAEMSKVDQEAAASDFRSRLKSGVEREHFAKTRWKTTLLAPQIRGFWNESHALPFPDFAEFCRERGIEDIDVSRARMKELDVQ